MHGHNHFTTLSEKNQYSEMERKEKKIRNKKVIFPLRAHT